MLLSGISSVLTIYTEFIDDYYFSSDIMTILNVLYVFVWLASTIASICVIFVPYFLADQKKLGASFMESLRFAKNVRTVVKYWFCFDVLPFCVLVVFFMVIQLLFPYSLYHIKPIIYVENSIFYFESWTILLLYSIFMPVRLFGYQICLNELRHKGEKETSGSTTNIKI